MYVKVGAYYGQNIAMSGRNGKSFNPVITNEAGKDIEIKNTSSLGVALAFGIKDIVPNLSAELGGSYALYSTEAKKGGKDIEDKSAYAVYVQTPYKVNQYVQVIPQVGYNIIVLDKADDEVDFMAGLQLRMLF